MALVAVVAILAGDARAQTGAPQPCAGPEFHQFDFWIGTWEVTSQGKVVGHNEIIPFAGGCALLENWTATSGGGGKSINSWRPIEKRWSQHWVGSGGTILDLSGGLVEGRMVLSGAVRQTPNGPVLDRITWTPVSQNIVRQVWDISVDRGATWQPLFNGIYTRKKP